MKYVCLILIVLFPVLNLQAGNSQSILQGKITDANGNPMIGTIVFLHDQSKGTISSNNGTFLLNNLSKGKTIVEFSHKGYNREIKTIVLKDGINTLDMILSESIIELREVVVSGATVSAQYDNTAKIDVVKTNEIIFLGSNSLMEAISQAPGVDMISKGQGISKPVIRGLSMNDVLVLNNGVRVENYQFSENHPMGIDDNDFERVEIIKGPAALLYGSDAIGGVINFIKEKPAPPNSILGDYQLQLFSNTKGVHNSLGLKAGSKHLFGGFRVNHKTHEDYKQGGGDFVPNSRYNLWSLSTNLAYMTRKGVFKFYYDYLKQDLGMTVPVVQTTILEEGRKNEYWYQDLEYQLFSSKNKLFLGNFKWENNIAYQIASRKLQTTLDVPVVEMNLNTFTYESKLYFPSNEKSEYIIGIQGLNQYNINQNDRLAQFLPDAAVTNIGFLGLVQYTCLKKLKLQAGLRYDIYYTQTDALGLEESSTYHKAISANYASPNGSFGLIYSIGKDWILRTNLAKAFRVPNLSELTSNGAHGNRYEIGFEGLQPEDAYEFDASVRFQRNFVTFDLTGFSNNINNYIYISPTNEVAPSGLDIYRFSQTDAKLYGGEVGIHCHPKTIPYLHLKVTYSSVVGEQLNGDYLPFMPAHKFRYEIRVKKEKLARMLNFNVWISALSALPQEYPSLFETKTEAYTLVNLGLSSNFKIVKQLLSLSLIANNIFDIEYFDHLSTLKALNYFNQGRNISFNLKIPIVVK